MITAKNLLETAKTIARERPDVRYGLEDKLSGACLYTGGQCSDGSTGCIFGQALVKIGITPAQVKVVKSLDCGLHSNSISNLLDYLKIQATEEELLIMRYAQNKQDKGVRWGDIFPENE